MFMFKNGLSLDHVNKQTFSTTSVDQQSEGSKIMNDLNNLVGGAKKSKKVAKVVKPKRHSSKKSRKPSNKLARKSSHKSARKPSRKSQKGGKREMNQAFKEQQEVRNALNDGEPKIKAKGLSGIPLNTFAWTLFKKFGAKKAIEEGKKLIESNKLIGEIEKVKEEQDKKKAAKKAKKNE